MPTETVAETPVAESTETFSSFRGNRGAGVPAVKEVKTGPLAKESDGNESSAATQPGEQKPSLEVASPAEAAPKVPGESEPPPKQDKFEKRKAQVQREIDDLVRQRETLRREVQSEPPKPAAKPAASAEPPKPAPAAYDGKDPDDPEPDPAKYTDWQKSQDDRQAWVARNMFRQLQAKAEEQRKAEQATRDAEQAAKTQKEAIQELNEDKATLKEFAATELAEDCPDFAELFAEIEKKPVLSPETGAITLYGGELGARLLYDLMSNPEKLEGLEKMKPVARIKALFGEIDQIAAKKYAKTAPQAESQTEPAQPRRSNAPKPVSTLSGSGPSKNEPGNFAAFRKQRFAN